MRTAEFQKIVYAHYKKHGRKLPWRIKSGIRGSTSANRGRTSDSIFYRILVSEIMLQQTQVDRVVPKYHEFLKKFPTMRALARANRTDVLRAWQGLGYNRRAVWLHEIAKKLTGTHERGSTSLRSRLNLAHFARTEELRKLKGIGSNTAASICAFAYNMPVIFIETNIRTVFLKYFFPYEKDVSDKDILKLIEKTLDKKNPRTWYWALMDLGSHIKRTEGNFNRTHSKHYAKQSKFEGSRRQLRGKILRDMLQGKKVSLKEKIHKEIARELAAEGLV
ncbi:hypothetical protein A2755_00490 [Candidatus Wolfebacteria bacterium RIFCSPHIGHO2_01_FULL_48_22]|uniref:HhH-GPD domain-containing protein n=2 Tax=Candidatus Wolfeibacteriota TaxID=1752735 RepID=A0A1F8DT93_9BACT|nr:MAG: hypothetical protein A2755_00490 [Candidatus Wolfebacteria bacterium RIFCSPHIGHO2_01_FULL_48_22]OGM93755.1 MAG: hypothetical protein A2935_03155 [Candidatus Wolfebacteria bacterium RIFCSPLOWO2_01_FULL_47_17b]